MKNPNSKPLRIVIEGKYDPAHHYIHQYGAMLSQLAIAQAYLVKAGKDSALPHFIAIVKELERVYHFKFEIMPPEEATEGEKYHKWLDENYKDWRDLKSGDPRWTMIGLRWAAMLNK